MATFTAGQVLTASDLTSAFNTATITAVTSTSHTFGTAAAGELVTLSNASGGTATIPANSTWGAATGTIVGVMNAGTAGSWTIGTAAGVTLNASSTSLAPLESGTIVKLATNTWQFVKGGGLPKATYSATTGSPTVTTVSGKTCVKFTGSGSITIGTAGYVQMLVIGGGGGGASGGGGGGGGAGGCVGATGASINAYVGTGTLTVTVGGGGTANSKGTDSLFGPYVAIGGGGGTGGTGGCGGGNGGVATGQQGFNGGASNGGGGGIGQAGTGSGGKGGDGVSDSIDGTPTTRGGGGGGYTSGAGGAGGGGAGSGTATNAGATNTGSGGGASGNAGGAGGSGIVILLFG